MSTKLIIGLDGHSSGELALVHAKRMAALMEKCELVVVYVIEWSPFSFQTAEENAERHKRRDEEIATATTRVVEPAVSALKEAGLDATGIVRHGDVAETLDRICNEQNAEQIIIGRSSANGLSKRIFGSAASNLVMNTNATVTVVGVEGAQ